MKAAAADCVISTGIVFSLERELVKCKESVYSSGTSQRMMCIPTLLPLKTTTRGDDIHNGVRMFFAEKKRYHLKSSCHRLVSRRDGPTCRLHYAMQRWHFSKCLHYHWIIHQQTKCAEVTGLSPCCWRSCQLNVVTCWYSQLARGWVCSVFFFCHFWVNLKSSCNQKGKTPHWECIRLKSYWWLMTTDDTWGTWWVVPFHRGTFQPLPPVASFWGASGLANEG